MTYVVMQVALRSVFLLISALIHDVVFTAGSPKIAKLAAMTQALRLVLRNTLLPSAGVGLLIVAHTITIWFWALGFYWSSTFSDFVTSFYFSTVTYTTLGYGDIVPDPTMRVIATLAAITGLLTFGLSTAFLVGFLVRLLPDIFQDHKTDRKT